MNLATMAQRAASFNRRSAPLPPAAVPWRLSPQSRRLAAASRGAPSPQPASALAAMWVASCLSVWVQPASAPWVDADSRP